VLPAFLGPEIDLSQRFASNVNPDILTQRE